MRALRRRERLAHLPGMLARNPSAALLPASVLQAWALRGLRWAPSPAQVELLTITREPTGTVAAAAIAAMDAVPPVGRTYNLVGAMHAAARRARLVLHKKSHSERRLHTVRLMERDEASPRAAESPPGDNADRPIERLGTIGRYPTGLAAWRALRDPGGALYRGTGDQLSDAAAQRVARQRVYLRDVRSARRRSLP